MNAARLYESPYTDFNPPGMDGVFSPAQVERLMAILEEMRKRVVAQSLEVLRV